MHWRSPGAASGISVSDMDTRGVSATCPAQTTATMSILARSPAKKEGSGNDQFESLTEAESVFTIRGVLSLTSAMRNCLRSNHRTKSRV